MKPPEATEKATTAIEFSIFKEYPRAVVPTVRVTLRLTKLKEGKSPDEEGMVVEMLKVLPVEAHELLAKLFHEKIRNKPG